MIVLAPYIAPALLLMALTACKPGTLPPAQYVQYVRDPANGLRQERTLGDYHLDLQYEPIDYAALVRLGTDATSETLVEERTQLAGLEYFQLRLGSTEGTEFLRTGIKAMDEYHGRLEYYTSQVQHDIILVTGTDTLPCVLHHFERTYRVSPHATLMLGFESTEADGLDLTLIYDDRALGLGTVKFTISGSSIGRLPQLRI